MKNKGFIGIDLGGTKICGMLSDCTGAPLARQTVPTCAEQGENAVMQRIIGVVETVLAEAKLTAEQIAAIGIGSPGSMDARQGLLIKTANLPFRNFNIVRPLVERFHVPVHLDNDANVAAIAEYTFGAGRGTQNMVFMTVSTGIGGGAVLNGKIYRGNTWNALEVGHTTVEKDGPLCGCGNHGCVEVLASGTAIGRAAKQAVANGCATRLSEFENPGSAEVFQLAAQGDAVAQEILDAALNYLGIGVANTIASFDPEMVVIGGGVAQAGQVVFDKVRQVVDQRCLKVMAENTRIVPAELGADAGVIGAVALAMMESR